MSIPVATLNGLLFLQLKMANQAQTEEEDPDLWVGHSLSHSNSRRKEEATSGPGSVATAFAVLAEEHLKPLV